MRKITAYEIALSALACALATIFLTVGIYLDVLLLTGYLLACIALMLPLAKGSYIGYALSYAATCILTFIFTASKFWDLLPFPFRKPKNHPQTNLPTPLFQAKFPLKKQLQRCFPLVILWCIVLNLTAPIFRKVILTILAPFSRKLPPILKRPI